MTFSNNMDRDQAPQRVGPDHWSILFETQHHFLLKTGCISWDDLNSENIGIMSSQQIVQELFEGTVCIFPTVVAIILHFNLLWRPKVSCNLAVSLSRKTLLKDIARSNVADRLLVSQNDWRIHSFGRHTVTIKVKHLQLSSSFNSLYFEL